MNIRISHIILLFAGYIVITAKTCETEPLPAEPSGYSRVPAISKLEKEFDEEYLIAEKQFALSEIAKQKLTDLADYMNLVSNKGIDPAFRQQAISSALSVFQTNNPIVDVPIPLYGNEKKTLQNLCASIDESAYASISFLLSNLTVRDALVRENDTLYTGRLACHMRVAGISGADTLTLFAGPVQTEFMAIRTLKKFGNKKTRQFWQVFLGEIRSDR